MLSDLIKLIEPLKRSIRVMLTMGIVTKVQEDVSGEVQQVQVDLGNDQVIDDVPRLQPFGLSSKLKFSDFTKGAETILISLTGNRDNPVILVADDSRFRVIVDGEGDVALYNSAGMVVHLKGEEIILGQGIAQSLTPLDGIITGQSVDTFTGIKLGALPGGNFLGTQNSQKLKVQL